MEASVEERRLAYGRWLRTGRWPAVVAEDSLELKFNPWHDPDDGRFTFAGQGMNFGGGRAGSAGRQERAHDIRLGRSTEGNSASLPTGGLADTANQARPPLGRAPVGGRGGNSRAFEGPMTLEQAFPGIAQMPGGSILAAADHFFDVTGPGNQAAAEVLNNHIHATIADIRTVDPTSRYDSLGPARTIEGKTNELNDLRLRRAVAYLQVKGDSGPLQVETLRFVQRRTDQAYKDGLALLKASRLEKAPTEGLALGNYIDRRVRAELRERYKILGVDSAGKGPVRVNRRENISSQNELTYRRPDARVDDVAYDVTLTKKTLGTAQVRGFFNADFQPRLVAIIRPSQLGDGHSYIISRAENTR